MAVAARQENSRMRSYASEQDGLQSEFSARHRAQEQEDERWRENRRREAPVDEFWLERVVAREQQRQNLGGWVQQGQSGYQRGQDRKEPSVAEQSRKEENNRIINRDREDRAERRALREQESTTEQKKRRKKEEHQEMSGKMKGLPD